MSTVLPGKFVKNSIKWSMVAGVVMIVAGLLAISLPLAAGIAVNLLIAWVLIFSGIAHLVYGWHHREEGAGTYQAMLFGLYVFIGGYLLYRPTVGLAALTLALGAFLLFEAVVEFALFARLRKSERAGWLAFDGSLTLIIAMMILASWPLSSEWAIGILFGISILLSGISRVVLSIGLRQAIR